MLLIATFMFEPAKLATNWARASGASILRAERPASAVGAASAAAELSMCTASSVTGSRPG
jgi:hypothetical protein